MSEISRDPEELVRQAMSEHHYPDGFVLFLGTLFAPTAGPRRAGARLHPQDRRRSADFGADASARSPTRDDLARCAAVEVRNARTHAQPRLARAAAGFEEYVMQTPDPFDRRRNARRRRAGESLNPSNPDDVVARYPKGGAAEVDAAVKAARAAFPAWSDASPEVRSDVLDKAGALVMSRAKELGTLLSREEGKTLRRRHGRSHARGAHPQIFRRRGAAAARPDARIRRGPESMSQPTARRSACSG